MQALRTIVILVVLLLVGAGIFIWSGVYNIGADDHHTPVVAKVLETLRERSVEKRAQDIKVPDLDSPAMIAEGAEHYSAMCTGCHLAPGMDDTEIRPGLYPHPPNLSKHGIHDPAEAFWVIKHGIKMSAMPAWGTTHGDEAIWNMVAFVRRLPNMTADQYNQLVGSTAGEDGHSHGHDEQEHHHGDEGEAGHHHDEGSADQHDDGDGDHHREEGGQSDHRSTGADTDEDTPVEPEPSHATDGR